MRWRRERATVYVERGFRSMALELKQGGLTTDAQFRYRTGMRAVAAKQMSMAKYEEGEL